MTRNLLATFALLFGLMVGSFAMAEESTWSVNINTATEAVLAESLEGIGENKAKAIIAYREANGGFKAIEELGNVKGIGAATIEKNRDSIVLK
jgi:competence protein ComEA